MAEKIVQPKTVKKQTKKQVKKEVQDRLIGALGSYRTQLGKKKFEAKIDKATKLFVVDLAKALRKEAKAIAKKKPQVNQ